MVSRLREAHHQLVSSMSMPSMGFRHEMEKTKGGIVWVPKEFKARQ